MLKHPLGVVHNIPLSNNFCCKFKVLLKRDRFAKFHYKPYLEILNSLKYKKILFLKDNVRIYNWDWYSR